MTVLIITNAGKISDFYPKSKLSVFDESNKGQGSGTAVMIMQNASTSQVTMIVLALKAMKEMGSSVRTFVTKTVPVV